MRQIDEHPTPSKSFLKFNLKDEERKTLFAQYVLMFLFFGLTLIISISTKNLFNFSYLLELFFFGVLFKFFFTAAKNRNYAYWGISFIFGIYLLWIIMEFTFFSTNILILYGAFLALLALLTNSYLMSSPLYFPRVQWWEYDFRYRGDLKAYIQIDEEKYESRLIDLRNSHAALEAFEYFKQGSIVDILIPYADNTYRLKAKIETVRQVIMGRPFRYGIIFQVDHEKEKKMFQILSRLWQENKKARLRKKFS